MDVETRFWQKVQTAAPDECWPWLAGKQGGGYGQFYPTKNQPIGAHRYSWQLHRGPIPAGLLVCHHCDNPACVNPTHLFLGTYADNNRDSTAKGHNNGNRTDRGRKQFALTGREDEVLALLAAGWTQRAVAHRFGISPAAVCRWRRSIGRFLEETA